MGLLNLQGRTTLGARSGGVLPGGGAPFDGFGHRSLARLGRFVVVVKIVSGFGFGFGWVDWTVIIKWCGDIAIRRWR